VTSLCTNFLKSSIAPIWCGNIDLDDVLQDILTSCATFPLPRFGEGLSTPRGQVCRQAPTWNGKMVNMAGRVSLVKWSWLCKPFTT
jgi:hypothetical protein